MQLADLVAPASTTILTQECQKGVIGSYSLLPMLAESAKAVGLVENVNRIVTAGRTAGCEVLHCIAASRPDRRGASSNAPLFQGSARNAKNLAESTGGANPMVPGGPGTELMDGIESAD